MTDTDFIRMIQNEMNSYNNKMPFSLIDDNCATLVNSVLKNIGIDDKLRETLGEFKGLDWGEEKIIPKKYFE